MGKHTLKNLNHVGRLLVLVRNKLYASLTLITFFSFLQGAESDMHGYPHPCYPRNSPVR